jgi:hypothetical protein
MYRLIPKRALKTAIEGRKFEDVVARYLEHKFETGGSGCG